TFVVFQIVNHYRIPQAALFQVVYQVWIYYGEFTREVGFHVEVLVSRFNRLGYTRDVGNSCSRCNRHHVGVTHTLGFYLLAQSRPVESLAAVNFDVILATVLREDFNRVNWQNAFAPQRSVKG